MKLCLSCRTPFESDDWTCPNCGVRPSIRRWLSCFAPQLARKATRALPRECTTISTPGRKAVFGSVDAGESSSRWCRVIVPDAKSFLEVGCGPGFVLSGLREVLPDATLVASEIYLHGLPYAARRVSPPVEFIQADCLALPYDQEFDAVGAFDVIEHIDREADAIAEMRRALAPDGVIFLTVPQHPWLWSRVDEIDDHKRRYRRGELSAKLRDSGFSVLCDTSFMFFLLPAMMAQRFAVNRSSTFYPDVRVRVAAAGGLAV